MQDKREGPRIAIIGAGVVGCAIARKLASLCCEVVVLERKGDVGVGTSKSNNSHIVCGADVDPSLFEHQMLRDSAGLMDQLTAELSVSFERCGALNVAFTEEEVTETLPALQRQAAQGGITNLEILSGDELRQRVPNINPEARAALLTPDDGVLTSYYYVLALAESAALNGASFVFNTRVTDLAHHPCQKPRPMTLSCLTHQGVKAGRADGAWTLEADVVINCAGLFSDEVSSMAGWDGFSLHPRRGEFFVLDKKYSHLSSGVVYGCPGPISRGATVLRTLDGNLLVGPTAEDITDKHDKSTTAAGLDQAFAAGKRLFPALSRDMTIAQFAGLRAACATNPDLIVGWHPDGDTPFINVAGIRSAGISCSPGLAQHVARLLRERMTLKPWSHFQPERPPFLRFAALSEHSQAALIDADPAFGRVVCRCETVTEGEVLAALRGPLPVQDLDGIKRRTRAQMGRCQGGFCTPRLVHILARELGFDPTSVTKRGPGSELLLGRTKDFQVRDWTHRPPPGEVGEGA